MFTRIRRFPPFLVILCAGILWAQEKSSAPAPGTPVALELPVTLKQTVEAGKTAVGTKIKAELVMATLIAGKTIPRGAILSGEVTESMARKGPTPCLLGIRLDSAQWKDGSAAIKAYLTPWFYPIKAGASPNLVYGPPKDPVRTWNGMGTYPGSPISEPFPDTSVTDPPRTTPDTPATSISNRRSVMKDVAAMRNQEGAIAISSERSNIKLDKLTTYVFLTSEAPKN